MRNQLDVFLMEIKPDSKRIREIMFLFFVRNQQDVFHMEIKTDSKRLREIMFHLFVWFKISIYYF